MPFIENEIFVQTVTAKVIGGHEIAFIKKHSDGKTIVRIAANGAASIMLSRRAAKELLGFLQEQLELSGNETDEDI